MHTYCAHHGAPRFGSAKCGLDGERQGTRAGMRFVPDVTCWVGVAGPDRKSRGRPCALCFAGALLRRRRWARPQPGAAGATPRLLGATRPQQTSSGPCSRRWTAGRDRKSMATLQAAGAPASVSGPRGRGARWSVARCSRPGPTEDPKLLQWMRAGYGTGGDAEAELAADCRRLKAEVSACLGACLTASGYAWPVAAEQGCTLVGSRTGGMGSRDVAATTLGPRAPRMSCRT
jgi:hypothetical protein